MAKREHTMFMQTSADIPLLIISENSQSERRISPAWTVSHLKERLEPITGVPASSQTLSLKVGAQPAMSLQVADEEGTQLSNFPLQAYAEIHVRNHAFLYCIPRLQASCFMHFLAAPRDMNDGPISLSIPLYTIAETRPEAIATSAPH